MKFFTVLLVFTLVVGCGQKPKKINRSIKEEFYVNSKAKECLEVSLYEGVFEKENILSLFDCVELTRKYLNLYNYIKHIPSERFNIIAHSFDETFFKTKEDRDKILEVIISKTKKNSSQSLSTFLTTLFQDQKKVEAFFRIFKLGKEKEYQVDQRTLNSYLHFMSELTHSLEESRSHFGKIVQIKNKEDDFSSFLQATFEDLLLDRKKGIESFAHILRKASWLPSLIHSLKPEEFEDIVFFLNQNKEFLTQVELFEDAINGREDLSCVFPYNTYRVDHQVEYMLQLDELYRGKKEDFYKSLINLITRFNLYKEICPHEEFINSTTKLLKNFTSFSTLKGAFVILKKFSQAAIEIEGNDYILMNFFSSKGLRELIRFLDDFETEEMGKVLHRFLGEISKKDIENLQEIFNSLLDNETFLKQTAQLWNSLKHNEKKSLLNYVTKLFVTKEDIYPAFKLFSEIGKEFPSKITDFLNLLLVKDIALLEDDISAIFEDKLLHEELLGALGKDGILRIIGLIQKRDHKKNEDRKREKYKSYVMALDQSKELNCLKDISKNLALDSHLDYVIRNYPKSCKDLQSQNFALSIYEWSKWMNQDFEKSFSRSIVGENYILNPDTMHTLHHLIHITTKYVRSDGDFSKDTVNTVKDFLFKEKNVEFVNKAVETILENKSLVQKLLTKVSNTSIELTNSLLLKVFRLFDFEKMEKFDCDYYSRIGVNCNVAEFYTAQERVLKENSILINEDFVKVFLKKSLEEELNLFSLMDFFSFLGKEQMIFVKDKQGKIVERKGSLARQLEIIVNELNFKNNYYVIYFLNQLAEAESYKEVVKKLKKDFKAALKLTPIMARTGILPRNAKDRFNLVNKNLLLLDSFFTKASNQSESYGKILIKLARVLQKMSPENTRKFGTLRFPSAKKVLGHKGQVVSVLSKAGLITQVSHYLNISGLNINNTSNDIHYSKMIKALIGLKLPAFNINKLIYRTEELLKNSYYDKKTLNKFFKWPNNVKLEAISYLELFELDKIKVELPSQKISSFETVIKVFADESMDYSYLLKTVKKIHQNDREYFLNLLKYMAKRNESGKTAIERGLEAMFVVENKALVNFFKDILMHFEYSKKDSYIKAQVN